MRNWTKAFFIIALGTIAVTSLAVDDAALVDANRKVAAELVKQGHAAKALSLIQQIITSESVQYSDYLLAAKAHEKLSQTAEAAQAYRKALSTAPAGVRDDKGVLLRPTLEARIKALDPNGAKVDVAAEEFLKKLASLRKEAAASKDTAALERIDSLIVAVGGGTAKDAGTAFDVSPKLDWQKSGITVRPGESYRITVTGSWTIGSNGKCGPDGLIDRGAYNAYGHDGQLLATTDGVKAMFALSRETTIKITTAGELSFGPNGNSATKAQNSGSLHVLIQRVEAQ